MNDEFRKMLEGNRLNQGSLSGAARLLGDSSSLAGLVESLSMPTQLESLARLHEQLSANATALSAINKHSEILRAALGPSEDFKRMIDALSAPSIAIAELQSINERYVEQFTLPSLPRIEELFKLDNTIAKIAEDLAQPIIDLKLAMEAMDAPWLNLKREIDSLKGFAALQGVGRIVNNYLGFDDEAAQALRSQLGDFRDAITFPPDIFEDISARSAFYIARGFNPKLTDFPAPAFTQGLRIANLDIDGTPPSLAEYLLEDELEAADTEEEAGFRRTNAAHDKLQRTETQLRRFIDVVMTANFGPDWPKSRLPNGLYDTWMDKKTKAEGDGRPSHRLIAYADFTEYALIICKRDNWPLFKPIFGREESVRESFQRLTPLRIATMHARLITQDDELFLVAEIKRLLTAIQRANEALPKYYT